jgi:hypothetical protein
MVHFNLLKTKEFRHFMENLQDLRLQERGERSIFQMPATEGPRWSDRFGRVAASHITGRQVVTSESRCCQYHKGS